MFFCDEEIRVPATTQRVRGVLHVEPLHPSTPESPPHFQPLLSNHLSSIPTTTDRVGVLGHRFGDAGRPRGLPQGPVPDVRPVQIPGKAAAGGPYSGPRKLDHRFSYTGGPAKGVRW